MMATSATQPREGRAQGGPQYGRLSRAISKDRTAALQSASWGISQIMRMNHAKSGFQDVEAMVDAMTESEDHTTGSDGEFSHCHRLALSLRAHDWVSLARGYNGPNYAINRYDVKLGSQFQKHLAGALPDLNVRAAQLILTYLGFHPGSVDGIAGKHTIAALAEFGAANGFSQADIIDDACIT